MIKVLNLREVSLATNDLATAAPGLAAITGHAGFPIRELPFPPVQSRFQTFQVGDRSFALMESVGANTPITRFIERSGPGAFSISLIVEDLDEALEHVRKRGARVVMAEPIEARDVVSGAYRFGRVRYNFLAPNETTHGLLIELQQLDDVELVNPVEPAAAAPFGIREVHCAVLDLERAVEDLSVLLGLDVGPEMVTEEPPEEVRHRKLQLGDVSILAVIAAATPTSTINRFLAKRGERIFSVSLKVTDIRAYMRRLAGAGIAVLVDRPKPIQWGDFKPPSIHPTEVNWIRPQALSCGTLFEIQQFPPPAENQRAAGTGIREVLS